jgi:hypothetical protein
MMNLQAYQWLTIFVVGLEPAVFDGIGWGFPKQLNCNSSWSLDLDASMDGSTLFT